MNENKIELKSIREILDKKFFIPNYQRGYRWTIQQVKELLEDIEYFSRAKRDEYQFYCMQPLVVREMNAEDKSRQNLPEDESWYEVIDGQQRLTTIYLILASLKDTLEILDLPTDLYELKYERETNNTTNLISNIDNLDICDSSIDYYHLSSAYQFIKSWFKETKPNKGKFCNALLDFMLDNTDHPRDKSNNLRFIWYESVNEDPIKVFTRLNIGKISLSNSELIKALFLNRTNFQSVDSFSCELRQKEIASEWDAIEYSLQDNQFWLFFHAPKYENATRIDFLFDLICNQNKLGLDAEIYKKIGNDEYKTFRYFFEYFKLDKHDIFYGWKCVKFIFQTLKEWYEDLEMYHYIGFLIACEKIDILTLLEKWTKSDDKACFLKYLKEAIKEVLEKCPELDYQYKIDGSDKGKCRPILLFHNIQTIINNNYKDKKNEKYQLGTFYKFPFHLYKLESWDVEHINSNTSNPEGDKDTQKEWLINIYLSADRDVQEKIVKFFNETDDSRRTNIFEEIRKAYPIRDDWSQEDKNRIWNYTLLDASTNRSYGNSIFSGKRRVIISKDKGVFLPIPKLSRDKNIIIPEVEEKECISSFVPQCTKHVFLKFYSAATGDNNYWEKSDAEAYLNDIRDCIKKIGGEDNE